MMAWACGDRGDCCTRPSVVVMTQAERLALEAATDRPLRFRAHETPGFVSLVAQPCPAYDATAKTCTAYEARPYNCRRFACMRTADAQAYDRDVARMSRSERRRLATIERHAQPWARAHGWEG